MTPSGVSIVALGVSSLSLIVSFVNYRVGGPRVVISARRIVEDGRTTGLYVEARNSGRGAITLNIIQLDAHQLTGGYVASRLVTESAGATLPYRLDGHAACEWILNSHDIENFLWRHEHNFITVAAKIGGRRRLRVRLASEAP